MMKYILYTIIIALFIGCKDTDGEMYPEPSDGLIKINVMTPQIATRISTAPMPANSTIRLFVYKQATWSTSFPELVSEETYRVNENGSTVVCSVDPATGEPTKDITNHALHLPADTYNFYSVSPAVKLDNISGSTLPGLIMDHGSKLGLRTSVLENQKIEYFSGEVSGGKPGIFNLVLDTHVLLTSKVTFKLIKGNKIGEMEFIDTESLAGDRNLSSIAIDNLPIFNYGVYNFIIGNNRLLQLQAPGGSGSIGLKAEEIMHITTPETEYQYYFEAEVLPCRLLDSEGDPIARKTEDNLDEITGSQLEKKITELRLHLRVSENTPGSEMNYKMYTVKLPEESFRRGHRYNYTLLVNLGGILVSGWTTDSNWETIIE